MPRASLLAVILLAFTAQAGELHITWPSNHDATITNYLAYYGPGSYGYTNRIDQGTNRNLILSVPTGTVLFFNVTAQNSNGIESSFAPELMAFVPSQTNAIVIFRGASNPSGPWTNLFSATNDASTPYGFYSTILIITNTP